MIVAKIIQDIVQWIKITHNDPDYRSWHVCISYKEIPQFKYDVQRDVSTYFNIDLGATAY